MSGGPEWICPRCGCGMESGWQYATCADFPESEQPEAHAKFCVRSSRWVCGPCDDEMGEEVRRGA